MLILILVAFGLVLIMGAAVQRMNRARIHANAALAASRQANVRRQAFLPASHELAHVARDVRREAMPDSQHPLPGVRPQLDLSAQLDVVGAQLRFISGYLAGAAPDPSLAYAIPSARSARSSDLAPERPTPDQPATPPQEAFAQCSSRFIRSS